MTSGLEDLIRPIITIDQRSLAEAFLSDILDFVPVVGEVAGLLRFIDAISKGDEIRAVLEAGDIILGLAPFIGDIADIITPTNFLGYMIRKGIKKSV